MDMFFIVRKANELKMSCTEILKATFSLEYVQKILISSGKRGRIYKPVITCPYGSDYIGYLVGTNSFY